MALILAIEPDRRQAAQLTSLIRARVNADLVLAETAEQALHAIGDRVPDLVLVPALLAPQDDATLAGALRVIAAAARIQMLTIPVLAATSRKKQPRGVLAKWRRRAEPAASGGCDPAVFGDQIAAYLAEAAAERAVTESDRVAAAPTEVSSHQPAVPSPGTAPVDEAIGIPAIEFEGIPAIEYVRVPEIGMAAVEIATAAVDEVAVAADTQTGQLAGVLADLVVEESSVDEPLGEPAVETLSAVETMSTADVPAHLPEPEPEASPLVEELRIVEVPIEAGGFAAVEASGGDLPIAVDAISLSPDEDAWDTEEQDEFFLGAYQGGELMVDEPAVYELQTDDLSLDLVSFDETPVDAPRSHSPAIATVQHHQATQRAALELTQAGPHELVSFGARPMWPHLEGMVAEELTVAEAVIAGPPATAVRAVVTAAVAAVAPVPVAPVPVASPIAAARMPAAPTAPPAKPEWLELIDSLRRDVERLRGQRTQPPPVAAARIKAASSRTAAPVDGVAGPASSASLARTPPVIDHGAKTKKQSGSAKPAQDEWGFFDPEQCGFAALLAKLDEITHLNDGV
jgi:hypothetical protein